MPFTEQDDTNYLLDFCALYDENADTYRHAVVAIAQPSLKLLRATTDMVE